MLSVLWIFQAIQLLADDKERILAYKKRVNDETTSILGQLSFLIYYLVCTKSAPDKKKYGTIDYFFIWLAWLYILLGYCIEEFQKKNDVNQFVNAGDISFFQLKIEIGKDRATLKGCNGRSRMFCRY